MIGPARKELGGGHRQWADVIVQVQAGNSRGVRPNKPSGQVGRGPTPGAPLGHEPSVSAGPATPA